MNARFAVVVVRDETLIHPKTEDKLGYSTGLNKKKRKITAKVKQRFFGAGAKYSMIKSSCSPDGKYIASGSEQGMPYIWDSHMN